MRNRWGTKFSNDPYYNPNLALDGNGFEHGAISRRAKPWAAMLS